MKRLNDLEYLKLSKFNAFLYNVKMFFCAIPGWFVGIFAKLWSFIKNCGVSIKDEFVDIFKTFTEGNWAVKLSFLIFGFGNLYYGQILRGVLFLLFEVIFIGYMFVLPALGFGGGTYWLAKANFFVTGATIGTEQGRVEIVEGILGSQEMWVPGDDSVKVLLYGLLTVVFIIGFIVTWRMQVKQCRICMDITAQGKKIKSGKDDLQSLLDDLHHCAG